MRFAPSTLQSFIKRRPYLSALLVVVLLLRAALPFAVERLVETTLAENLSVSIDLDNVDLSLLRGLFAADGVRVAPPDSERDENGDLADGDVVVGWKRFELNVSWLSLAGGEIGLSSVDLIGPIVQVVRNEDETINLVELFMPLTEDEADESAETETTEAGSEPMPVAIKRLAIHRGHIVFEDRTIADSELLALAVGPLIVDDFTWPLPSVGNDSKLALELELDGGVVKLAAGAAQVDGEMSVSASLDAENLRLADVRGYTGSLGWVDLRGFVDAQLTYEFVGSTVHSVKGDVALRRLAVGLPDYDRVPLYFDRLVLADADIDLVEQRAGLGELRLNGGTVTADPRYGPVLPIIIGVEPDDSTADEHQPKEEQPTADQEDAVTASPEEDTPWSWSLGRIDVTDLTILVLTEGNPLAMQVALGASDIASDSTEPFPLTFGLVDGDATFDVEGKIRMDPPAAALSFDWRSLDLARLATAMPLDDARMLRSGKSTGKLRVGAGMSLPVTGKEVTDPNESGDLVVAGELSLDEFDIDLNPTMAADAGWQRIETEIASLTVPAALGDEEAKGNAGPIAVRVGKLVIEEPQLHMVLDGAHAAEADEATAAEQVDEAPDSVATVEDTEGPTPVEISIENFELRGAQVDIEERNVDTPFSGGITASEIKSALLSWPEMSAHDLAASGSALKSGEWSIDGDIRKANGDVEIELDHIPLVKLSPLTDDAAGLTIRRGTLSLDSEVKLESVDFDSRNKVTAHDLDLSGEAADKRFTANFGMPLSVVLALLKDPGGKISLDLPVSAKRGQTRAGLTTALTAVIREAIVGAATSPLKLVGSVVVLGGKVTKFSLDPVEFAPGSSVVEPAHTSPLQALAATVNARPGLVLELRPIIVESDVRRLKERALIAAFDSDTPLGADAPDVSWLERRRLRKYVEELDKGEVATLEADDLAQLTTILAARPRPDAALAALAVDRVANLKTRFREDYQLEDEQLRAGDASDSAAEVNGRPRVEFALATADVGG